jgi:glutathione S-transferase
VTRPWDSRGALPGATAAGPAGVALFGSPLCPYLLRARVALHERGAAFQVSYLETDADEARLRARAPTGRVPALRAVDPAGGEVFVFDSLPMLDYLEESFADAPLHPRDAAGRADHRSWMQAADDALAVFWRVATAHRPTDLDVAVLALRQRFRRLEARLGTRPEAGTGTGTGPYFDGAAFSNVDVAFAPVVLQIDALDSIARTYLTTGFPRIEDWFAALRARPAVIAATPPDHAARYVARLRHFGGVVLEAG